MIPIILKILQWKFRDIYQFAQGHRKEMPRNLRAVYLTLELMLFSFAVTPAAAELKHLRPEPSKELRVDIIKEVSGKCQNGEGNLDSVYFINLVLLYQLMAKHSTTILDFCFSYSF